MWELEILCVLSGTGCTGALVPVQVPSETHRARGPMANVLSAPSSSRRGANNLKFAGLTQNLGQL
jgi:hypothetical protein